MLIPVEGDEKAVIGLFFLGKKRETEYFHPSLWLVVVVPLAGFEPATLPVEGVCSIR